MTSAAIKRHGGKHYLAKKILSLFPPRCQTPNKPDPNDEGWLHYVEPFFGGGAVLFAQNPEGISEVVNDLDLQLCDFWSVLASDELFAEFVRRVEALPMSELLFDLCQDGEEQDQMSRAVAFFVVNRQSRQALGKDFATLTRNRTRRGMNEQASAWLSAVEGLVDVHARLKRVVILNRNAVDVIKQQDGLRTLFYCDPPYLHETRMAKDAYQHEMSEQDHADLLLTLEGIDGRFLLSGYRSQMYDDHAADFGWHRTDFSIDNKASSKATKETKTECVWTNFEPHSEKEPQ